jgi:hypothetical protein
MLPSSAALRAPEASSGLGAEMAVRNTECSAIGGATPSASPPGALITDHTLSE